MSQYNSYIDVIVVFAYDVMFVVALRPEVISDVTHL